MNDQPLISVLTAAYNGARHLPALIESVRMQEYRNWEHLVLDDGSRDDGATAALLAGYPHLRSWRQENAGQYAAQNALLDAARGDIVTIINQDDAYVSADVFSRIVELWQRRPGLDFVYGNVRYLDDAGAMLPYRYAFEGRRSRWLMTHVSCIYHIALFVRRELVEREHLRFDPALKMGGDWDWNLRMIRAAGEYAHVRRPLACFRIHPQQKTLAVGERGFAPEVRMICRRHGINPLLNAVLRRYVNLRFRLNTWWAMLRAFGPIGLMRRGMRSLKKRFSNTGNRPS